MPLTAPPLNLPPTPRAAADARRWVARLCEQLGREDLVECAELGTSELVANAILHGVPPISVAVRGTATHPRIEVRDGSPITPAAPATLGELDDALATFGRGLSLVSLSAIAWGASVEGHGKVVWFEPAAELGESGPTEPVFDHAGAPTVDDLSQRAVRVELVGIDVELSLSLRRQYYDLRRELRLLSVAHHDQYPLAANLSAMFASYERQLPKQVYPALKRAQRNRQKTVDVTAYVEPEASPIFTTMLELFDLADAFCRAERLLSMERTSEQRRFQQWYLGQLIAQIEGVGPTAFDRTPRDTNGGQQVS